VNEERCGGCGAPIKYAPLGGWFHTATGSKWCALDGVSEAWPK
jgi:hypothetical protein